MKTPTIGPVVAACAAGVTLAGCLAAPGARPVKLTAVNTPSAPASKIDLYYSGAVRAIETRDYARALDFLQTARAIAPEDVRVINAFGVVYDKLGRFDLSRRYYAEAKTLEPASKILENNLAYSERLQGLSHEPMAFASASAPESKLSPHSGLMPGSPVVVVPIASGPAPVIMVATVAPAEAAPELFKPARRTQVAAANSAAVKPAAAQVARVEVAAVRPAAAPAAVTPASIKPVAAPAAAAPSAVTPASVKPAAAPAAVTPGAAVKLTPAKAPAKLAGAPILLVDQSGSPEAAQRLSKRLTKLGWSVQIAPVSHAKPVELSRIDYPTRTPQIAHALARTLPGAVSARVCAGGCTAIRLVVGKDARVWSLPKKAVSRS
ncbi:MAG: LytR C-terminal domain-containing protein [Caulobacteraceae bacterium]